MHDQFAVDQPLKRAARRGRLRLTEALDELGRNAAVYHREEVFAVKSQKAAEGGAAQTHRFFQHRVEYRRQVAGRGVDDLQHFGGCGLLLQRFSRFGQQPRILHRNDRLRGEVLQQGDFSF